MKIHYVSGSRADFGLMRRCLQAIDATPEFDLGLVLTGQHTSPRYGNTAKDVHDSQLPIVQELPVSLSGTDGAEMANALACELTQLVEFWKKSPPQLALVLGDRGEMVAAALAAVHLGIFVAHIHGGERSGTLDESFRHVISKLAHYHFPVTEEAAERLHKMGEAPDTITVIGAPGLVGVVDDKIFDRSAVAESYDLPPNKPTVLLVFHPVVQEANESARQIKTLVETILEEGYSAIVLRPNSDAGGQAIDHYLDSLPQASRLHVVTHMERNEYLRTMASVDLIIGNSSSGIIESASFGVPCVNLGSRQDNRLRNNNTVDCRQIEPDAIRSAVRRALSLPHPFTNSYGDGHADRRLVEALKGLDLDPVRLKKCNIY